MSKTLGGLLLILLVKTIDNQLIRSVDVYKGVIKNVCGHYECFSILLFYRGSPQSEDIDVMTKLKNLSMYFENELLIRTTVTDISSYAMKFNEKRFRLMVKPLFVLLNDSDDIKVQFTETLVPLMDVSRPMWIMFTQDQTSVEDFFRDVYIPFNSKFMISKKNPNINDSEIITEIYRVYYGKPLKQDSFATWNISTGMNPPTLTFNQRRTNLDQINLRISATNYPPASVVEKDKYEQVINVKGFCATIIQELRQKLNFSVSYQLGASVGLALPNGTWSGVTGFLLQNSSDMFMTNTQIISDRTHLLDYTTPLYIAQYRFYLRKSLRVILSWDQFFRPFKPSIWISIGFTILLGSLMTFTIKHLEKKQLIEPVGTKKESWSILHAFLSVFGAFCVQGMPNCRSASLNLVQFTIHITSIIIFAAYSAILTSFLTTHILVNFITTTNELLNDSSYQLAIVKGSTDSSLFQNTTSKLLKRVYQRILKNEKNFPSNRLAGLQRVCYDKNFAFMSGQIAAAHFNMANCTLASMDVLVSAPMSMVLQHNSPFRRVINYQLNLMRESGVLGKMLQNITIINEKVDKTWTAVQLIDIMTLIVLLVASFIISMVLMLGERIFYLKQMSQKLKDQQRLVVRVKPMIHKKALIEKKNKFQKVKKISLARAGLSSSRIKCLKRNGRI